MPDVCVDLDSVADLQLGDVIVNKGSGQSYVVVYCEKFRAVALRTVMVDNPSEWERLARFRRDSKTAV